MGKSFREESAAGKERFARNRLLEKSEMLRKHREDTKTQTSLAS